MTGGVLILSHCGYSFVEDLIEAVRGRGLKSYVLSSLPVHDAAGKRVADLNRLAEEATVTGSHVLSENDLAKVLNEAVKRRLNFICCITVWEGYRELMAQANFLLDTPDIERSQVRLLRDKLALRTLLYKNRLSAVKAQELTQELLEDLKTSGRDYFLKPVTGLASYGATRLRPDTQWGDITSVLREVADDPVYSSVLNQTSAFMVEDYITGQEFSFETILVDGETYVLAIHEKCEVTETARTVLEECCTSPPVSIGQSTISAGIRWLKSVFSSLGIVYGCFHVEARYSEERWELIELNPRVGGSLISRSVCALNGVATLLALWLDALLYQAGRQRGTHFSITAETPAKLAALSYTASGEHASTSATFFRVYFAQEGWVDEIVEHQINPRPIYSQILLQPGGQVSGVSREVFLGQMLWAMTLEERTVQYEHLLKVSSKALEIRYRARTEGAARQELAGDGLFIIVDYNLSRVDDVRAMANYATRKYCSKSVLIRPNPGLHDFKIADHVIDLDPLDPDFNARAIAAVEAIEGQPVAGVVFSDNAVETGARLLRHLGLDVDSPALADAAFSKLYYRKREAAFQEMFEARSLMVPRHRQIKCREDLDLFASTTENVFVVKPSCEGNNLGVVLVGPDDDLESIFQEISPYVTTGVLAEEKIPFNREFSLDGLGTSAFITEKVSAAGKYPVEIGQLLPARISANEQSTIGRAGEIANLLVGQAFGPFHNEIKLSDDGKSAAVVEPNRRPSGMKIWTLAEAVYGHNLYTAWVDAAFGHSHEVRLEEPKCQAATVMLNAPKGYVHQMTGRFLGQVTFGKALERAGERLGLPNGALKQLDFVWLASDGQTLPAIPKTNADFLAMACFALERLDFDIMRVFEVVRETWLSVLTEQADGTILTDRSRSLMREETLS